MQRLTRYPLLIKQILHYSKVENSKRDSFKKADISSILNSLETQIIITECNPFSEMGPEVEKKANPFSEIKLDENPFDSNFPLTSGTSVLVTALTEIELILSRANEAAQKKENSFKLSQLQSQLGGNKILLTNGRLKSPTLLPQKSRKKSSMSSSRSFSISPTRPNTYSMPSFDGMTLFHKEIIDLPSETKHREPRIWIKDGILEDCSSSRKEPIYCVLCSDLILLLHFEPESIKRVTPESKFSLAYKVTVL